MVLQISFDERPIYKAPLEVLQHLYYYTTQYGLSVKQFTGAHQSYWEQLPERLNKVKDNRTELGRVITELENLAEGAEERLQKRRLQKDCKWAEKEIVLNAQLLSVLAAFPDELLSDGFNELFGRQFLPKSLRIVDMSIKKEDGKDAFVFVEPDMLLLGSNHLLMVELKTRGGAKSSRNYPPSQLLNYFRLIAECQDSENDSLPTDFSHLILVPSTDRKWIEQHDEWVLTTCDSAEGRFVLDTDRCIELGGGKSSYNHERVRNLLTSIPIYYRSWEQLEKAFKRAAHKYENLSIHEHLIRICKELSELAVIAGKYK